MNESLQKYLVVDADDFGLSAGVNRGIIETHERGIVTSASLMVRGPAVEEAAAYCKSRPQLGAGLHLDFGEWAYKDGRWSPLYQVVDNTDAEAVRDEALRQLERFRELLGKDPDHLDSHQHVHRREPVKSVALEIARMVSVPLRLIASPAKYCGAFYGQSSIGAPLPENLTVDALMALIEQFPPGVTEMCCHPGYGADVPGSYLHEREQEVRALCDPRVRAAVDRAGIKLVSFVQLPR